MGESSSVVTTSTPKTKAGSKRSRPSSAHSASHSAAHSTSHSAAHSTEPSCSTVEENISSDVELILWAREKSSPGTVSSPKVDDSPTESQKSSDARYIKTTGNATMCHISKYLSMRLSLERSMDQEEVTNDQDTEKSFILSIITPGTSDHTELPGDITLDQVNSNYWKQNKPIDLYYTLTVAEDA